MAYMRATFGDVNDCRKAILADFFRHGFDGSGVRCMCVHVCLRAHTDGSGGLGGACACACACVCVRTRGDGVNGTGVRCATSCVATHQYTISWMAWTLAP